MGGFFSGSFLGGGGLLAGCLTGAGCDLLTCPPSAESTSSFTSCFFCSAPSLTFASLVATGGGAGSCSLRFFGCGSRPLSPSTEGLVGLTEEVTAALALVGGPGLLGCGGAGFLGADTGGGLAGPGAEGGG